jgi:CubicO group peptidase (beta-lactamase class C family)
VDAARLAELAAEHRVPGAQLAVHQDGRTCLVHTGVATCGSDVVVDERSTFPIGSLTKPFTATLAMLLVSDGDVDLDAPLAEHLPAPACEDVTLGQVLSHTGGMAAGVDGVDFTTTAGAWVAALPGPVHPPGTVFSYSNAGYLLAGHLVATITGMSWWEAVRTMVLRPLGCTPAHTTRASVTGHTVQRSGRVRPIVEQSLLPVEDPIGALALSADDLVTFVRLHLADRALPRLLDVDTAAEMRRDRTAGLPVGPFGLADGWGLGWSVYRRGGRDWFGHDGTADGTWSHLRFEPGSGTVVALNTNASSGLALWGSVVADLRREGLDVGDHPLAVPVQGGQSMSGPPDAVGRYANGEWECVVAAGRDGVLSVSVGEEPEVELADVDGLRFAMPAPDGHTAHPGRFVRAEETGAIDCVQLTGRLARRSG